MTAVEDQRTQSPGHPAAPGRLAVAVALAVLLVAAVGAALAVGTPNSARWTLLGLIGVCWALFAAAAWALLRVPARQAVPLMLLVAVVLQAVAVAVPPRSTDDFYRYAWDGRVQASGVDPYRHPPTDPSLAGLRDPWLFPPECQDRTPVCTRMNHPTDPTIYPPVAEGAFLVLHLVTRPLGDDGGREKPLQLAGALVALAATLLLLRTLRGRGDPRRAVLWAWCPTVVLEGGNNAHIDLLAGLFVIVALGAAAAGRQRRAGLALGAAIATKLLPVLLLPALVARVPVPGRDAAAWRRWLGRVVPLGAACLAVIVLVYLPHVLAVGSKVLGFLPAYLDEEGYQGGARFPLLQLVLPRDVAGVAGVLLLAGVALAVALRGDPERPWAGATVVAGTAFALAGVTYPWYPVLLVALVALGGRAEWLAVAAAAYPGYFSRALGVDITANQQVSYGLATAFVAAVTLARARPLRRSRR